MDLQDSISEINKKYKKDIKKSPKPKDKTFSLEYEEIQEYPKIDGRILTFHLYYTLQALTMMIVVAAALKYLFC